ncbi:metal resistance protein YCF1 [Fusarium bulbicola]|nr:metal resistance protein YCF1 [Fusarium bulbicola]
MSGSVGCGKTTLIRSIIGDIVPTRGQFSIHGRISYAPQKPFLTSGTIRDNILFGLPFDAPFYQRVIEAASLSSDLSRLPQGDETPMGGTGATLSGGQKSRVGLARAIYARREVIVLDDPLAALDAQVQSHVIAEVLGPHGILKDSLRITTTSSTALMSIADRLYTICDGTVARTASPTHTQTTQTLTMPDASPEEIHGLQRQPPLVANYGSIKSNTSTQITPCDSDGDQGSAPLLLKVPSKLQSPDMRSEPVALGTYLRFLSLSKYGGWLWVMFTAALSKLFDILAVYYLKLSSQDFESQGHSTKLLYYSICALIGGSLSMIFVLVAFYVCIIPTSLSIHRQLTKGVLEAKFSFFDTHSLGQILNRFTNDINKIDTSVNGSLISLSALCITTSSSLFIMISVTPLSLLYLVPTAVVYLMIQSHYLHGFRQLRRLDNLARAPVLNQAAENRLASFQCPPTSFSFAPSLARYLPKYTGMRATLEADITSAERVWSYAANVPESQSSEEQRPAPSWPKVPVINFESYSASYASGQVPCLRDLSFSIAAGEHIAVVGRTGAGKSSLSLALLRALEQGDSYSGRITIDGVDISKACLADLRNRITFLP